MPDLQLHCELSAPAEMVFYTWQNGYTQGNIIGALCKINPIIQGHFELWNGAVEGIFLDIQKPHTLKMTWKTIDFAATTPPTLLTLTFQQHAKGGSRLIVTHENIPEMMLQQFKMAWEDVYFPQARQFFFQHFPNG